MTQEQLEAYHEYTRKHGVNRGLYLFARIVLQPFFLIYLRLSRQGRVTRRSRARPSSPPITAASSTRS